MYSRGIMHRGDAHFLIALILDQPGSLNLSLMFDIV